jgi:guanyl-specific ribonuclease Sa
MLTALRTHVRAYLGVDAIPRLESTMATITDALTALAEQVNAVSAAQASSFSNLQNAIAKLKSGDLSAEQQDAVNQIEKSLLTMGEDAQRADDGFEPTDSNAPVEPGSDVPAGTEPTAPPVEGGNTTR